MAISPKMLAVIQKVDAASKAHLALLRERGKLEAAAKARAKQMADPKKKPPARTAKKNG